jgi:hypothetical protein
MLGETRFCSVRVGTQERSWLFEQSHLLDVTIDAHERSLILGAELTIGGPLVGPKCALSGTKLLFVFLGEKEPRTA